MFRQYLSFFELRFAHGEGFRDTTHTINKAFIEAAQDRTNKNIKIDLMFSGNAAQAFDDWITGSNRSIYRHASQGSRSNSSRGSSIVSRVPSIVRTDDASKPDDLVLDSVSAGNVTV